MNIEQAKELKNTILWEEFCKEIDNKITYYLTQLTVCGPEDLVAIQKQIAALNSVKNIPQDVIDRESS